MEAKKRGRSFTGEKEPRTPCDKTPPTKRHTRSQSRKRAAGGLNKKSPEKTPQNLADVIDLAGEEDKEEVNMSKTPQELEAASIKSLADMA